MKKGNSLPLGFLFSVIVAKKIVHFKEQEKETGTHYRRKKIISEGACESYHSETFSTSL